MKQVAFRSEPALHVGPRRDGIGFDQLVRRTAGRPDERTAAAEIGEAKQRVSALPFADKITPSAQLKVVARDLESVAVLADHLDARFGRIRQVFSKEEDADAVARATADPASQLMQLGEAEALGAFDDHQ